MASREVDMSVADRQSGRLLKCGCWLHHMTHL
jgi:hypothetical protein